MSFDKIMNHTEAKAIVKELGFEGFVKKFEDEFGYQFFSCSTYWYDANTTKYICKLKGGRGDLIIGWQGVHDVG